MIKALDIRRLIVSNLALPTNMFYHTFSALSISALYLLNPAVIAQNYIPNAELAIPTGTSTNKTNAEMET